MQVFSRCYIGLGSNLEVPERQLERAIVALAQLPSCRLVTVSSLYRSAPLGPAGQPDYINAVAMLDTGLSPLGLLDALQAIETAHARVRNERWGPRTLDLDLLLYGQQSIDTERLQVPHPQLRYRPFVLYPMAELAPELVFPDGETLQALLQQCPADGLVKLRPAVGS